MESDPTAIKMNAEQNTRLNELLDAVWTSYEDLLRYGRRPNTDDVQAFSSAYNRLKEECLRLTHDEPSGWMAEDGRVVSSATFNGAKADGGAIWSSMKAFSIPLYARPNGCKYCESTDPNCQCWNDE